MKMVTKEQLEKKILFKRVIEWSKDFIKLEDGTTITLECTDHDCCAGAYGEFEPASEYPPLDAMITDIIVGDEERIPDDDTIINRVELKIFHNQNFICKATMEADAGNGGYYYSIGSIVVGDIFLPIVSA